MCMHVYVCVCVLKGQEKEEMTQRKGLRGKALLVDQ